LRTRPPARRIQFTSLDLFSPVNQHSSLSVRAEEGRVQLDKHHVVPILHMFFMVSNIRRSCLDEIHKIEGPGTTIAVITPSRD
jgi:hypothetical protein